MDEQNVYLYNAILLSFKKEENSDTHYKMDGTGDIVLSDIRQSQKDILYHMIPFMWGAWNHEPYRQKV